MIWLHSLYHMAVSRRVGVMGEKDYLSNAEDSWEVSIDKMDDA